MRLAPAEDRPLLMRRRHGSRWIPLAGLALLCASAAQAIVQPVVVRQATVRAAVRASANASAHGVGRPAHDARDESPAAWQASQSGRTVVVRRDNDSRRLRGDCQGRPSRRSPRDGEPLCGRALRAVAWRPGAALAAMFHEAHAPPA
jgi:hypothetical protein